MEQNIASYTWRFPFSNGGTEQGYNVPGLENFRSTPYESLAREICQNSLDASHELPVKVVFEMKNITPAEFPGFSEIQKAVKQCAAYWQGDHHIRRANKKNLDGMKIMMERLNQIIRHNTVSVLHIGDYNTHGARGSQVKAGSEWTGLVREIGSNIKVDGSGGSVGVGKYAPFLLSGVRTLFYGTIDTEGRSAFQGHSILTSFADENGKGRQGDGFWGFYDEKDEWNKPLTDFSSLATAFSPLFTRNEVGTDIFVMDFKQESYWQEQLICSIINNFFFSIWKGMLEVRVNNILICKDTLQKLIQRYDPENVKDGPSVTIGKYFTVLCPVADTAVFHVTKETSKNIPRILQDMGDFELFFTFGQPDDTKGLLKMRRQGMTIEETSDFCRGMIAKPLCIFRAIGHNGNSTQNPLNDINMMLQECEDGRHNCWKEANCKNEEVKDKAKKVLRQLTTWIKSEIQEHVLPVASESLPAFGISLTTDDDGEEPQEMDAFSELNFETYADGKKKRKHTHKDISLPHTSDTPDVEESMPNGLIRNKNGGLSGNLEDSGYGNTGGDGTKGPTGAAGQPLYTPGDVPGFIEGFGKVKQNEKIGKSGIVSLSNVRVIIDEENDVYKIAYTPTVSCPEAYLEIRIKNYDNRMEPVQIQSVTHRGNSVPCTQNKIGPMAFTGGKRMALSVALRQMGRYTLGVNAYVKK